MSIQDWRKLAWPSGYLLGCRVEKPKRDPNSLTMSSLNDLCTLLKFESQALAHDLADALGKQHMWLTRALALFEPRQDFPLLMPAAGSGSDAGTYTVGSRLEIR